MRERKIERVGDGEREEGRDGGGGDGERRGLGDGEGGG